MNKEIYIDLTQYINNRLNTGIQRVVKEYLLKSLEKYHDSIFILYYCNKLKKFYKIPNNEIKLFLNDVNNYIFKRYLDINIFYKDNIKKIFFEIDSVWNAPYKRSILYPKLKKYNFIIANFIHDLIPVLFPQYMYKDTKNNFPEFIDTVYKYSDLVFLNSKNTQNDFINYNKSFYNRPINNEVIKLGTDFTISSKEFDFCSIHKKLLTEKYLLFVGTIEPRKQQELLFDTFLEISKKFKNLKLIYIGKIGWNSNSFITKLYSHPKINKDIFHFKNISDDTLEKFYKNAYISIYLSKYEGYGLPLMESIKNKKITITSKNSSMKEITKNKSLYADNKSKLKHQIIKLLINKKHYSINTKKVKYCNKTVTWASTAKKINNIFIEI